VTERKALDGMTSNDLDQLYERVAKAEEDADASVAAAARLTTLVGKRSEKAERAAKGQRLRADIAETELRVLRSGLRAVGADPTQIQNLWAQIRLRNRQWREEKQRAEQAEATLREVLDAFEAYWARASYCGPDMSAVQPEHLQAWRATLDGPAPAAGQATDTKEQP
jgi:hypothetical protein